MLKLSLLEQRNQALFDQMLATKHPDMRRKCEANIRLIPLCIPYYCREVAPLIGTVGYKVNGPKVYDFGSSHRVVVSPREGMEFGGEWYSNFDILVEVRPSDRPPQGQEWAPEWADLSRANPLSRLWYRTVRAGRERFDNLDPRMLMAEKPDWLLSIYGGMLNTGGGHYDREFRNALSNPDRFRTKEMEELQEREEIKRRNAQRAARNSNP